MDAWLAEARRNEAAARARLDARVAAAEAEAAAICSGAWTVKYCGFRVRSPDEAEVTFRCDGARARARRNFYLVHDTHGREGAVNRRRAAIAARVLDLRHPVRCSEGCS